MTLLDIYYFLRPIVPRRIQIGLRRAIARNRRKKVAHCWPILPSAGTPPECWKGWPEGKQFALVLTHDVETQAGHDKCRAIMDMEESLGFRSSFNFVPERYHVSEELRNEMTSRGFEVGVHGLKHDGHLFRSRRIFDARKPRINHYLHEWKSMGFRSPSMRRNLKWIGELDIEYDSSTFDTDPFEPQPDSATTIFPYRVQNGNKARSYLELPYTLPQDHLMFVILQEKTTDIWKKKLDWIAEHGGMALLNTHTDYMCFEGQEPENETYPVAYYTEFLEYIDRNYKDQYWHVLPQELVGFWKKNLIDLNAD